MLVFTIGMSQAQETTKAPEYVKSVTAISRVLGDGRKVETVVMEYDTPSTTKALQ